MLDEKELADAKEAFQRWAEHNPYWTDSLTAFLAGYQIGSDPITYDGVSTEPQDRVSRLCDVAAKAIRKHPEGGKTLRLVVMIEADEGGACEISGYRDSATALVDIMSQVMLMAEAHDMDANELFRMLITRPKPSRAPAAFKTRR